MEKNKSFIKLVAVLLGFFVVQSCSKDNTTFKIYQSFTTPVATSPSDGSTVKLAGTTTSVDLKWTSTNQDGDTPISDVYFGTTASPSLLKSNNTTFVVNVPVAIGITYYWKIIMKDARGVTTTSPTWSFTIFDPIGIFVGDFNADEPAEDYSYGVSFVKASTNSITTSNYWNSGWAATFTLDLTKLTYTMPLTTWGSYSGIESGTINATTGKMVGNYTIYYKGGAIETGVHTYTRL